MYQFMVRKPYCVSRLIQSFLGCYRFYIYCKRLKINTIQNGRCTRAWAAIVFLVGFAALSIFGSIKFNDNPFLRGLSLFFAPKRLLRFLIIPINWNFMINVHLVFSETDGIHLQLSHQKSCKKHCDPNQTAYNEAHSA